MIQPLFRILYCSRNCIDLLPSEGADALSHIFQAARANNSRCGVTGALLYSSGFFAQVLEGPKAEIERVFERIQQDLRHDEITVLECSDITSRDFPQWSMAHVRPVSSAQTQVTGEALHHAMGNPDEASSSVLELLRSLVIQDT